MSTGKALPPPVEAKTTSEAQHSASDNHQVDSSASTRENSVMATAHEMSVTGGVTGIQEEQNNNGPIPGRGKESAGVVHGAGITR